MMQLSTEAKTDHVLHEFDFDERARGNVEDVPRGWTPMRMHDFPRFARGSFDMNVGRNAPPSFYLSSEGRNVAYQYSGFNLPVRPKSSYRISGFIRTDRIEFARACLSAAYLDEGGHPILETMLRSDWIGPPSSDNPWHPVQMELAPAPPTAKSIGLVAWVLQEDMHDKLRKSRHEPSRIDVHAAAWFDDIRIETAPRAELFTSEPSNVLQDNGQGSLRLRYLTNNTSARPGDVRVWNIDGREIARHLVYPQLDGESDYQEIPLGELAPGLYTARFRASEDQSSNITQELAFAVVASWPGGESATAKTFGVVLRPDSRADSQTELALLQELGVLAVKVPVELGAEFDWSRGTARSDGDKFLYELTKRGFNVTGVMYPPQQHVRAEKTDGKQTLVEWLTTDAAAWNEAIASVIATYGGIFRTWQMGPDESPEEVTPASLKQAITLLLDGMRRFTTSPALIVPIANSDQLAGLGESAEFAVMPFEGDSSAAWLSQSVSTLTTNRGIRLQTYFESLKPSSYRRLSRLAIWAQRLITLKHSGAQTLFVPQPWLTQDRNRQHMAEPTEEFILFRTIVAAIGDATPGKELKFGPGIHCLVFEQGDNTTLAIWDSDAPEGGRTHELQLGQAKESIDLWGRRTMLEKNEQGRHMINLTPTPVFVPGVEKWLVDFTTSSLSMEPQRVESGTELVIHRLRIDYFGDRPLTGQIKLDTPDSWEVTPREIKLNLQPRRAESREIQIRYPHNEPAGNKTIMAHVTITETGYQFDIPMTVSIDLSDIQVEGTAFVDGDVLILRHVVTNRSNSAVSFRGSARATERERQYRPFASLQPGETQTVEYRFSNAQLLSGTRVRLTLSEVNDGRRNHTLELQVP